MPVNPKKYIDQLIKGLEQLGHFYDYSNKRFFSQKTGRYCTKYFIASVENKKNCCESYNKIEILKYLVREYSKYTDREIPESCRIILETTDYEVIDKKDN